MAENHPELEPELEEVKEKVKSIEEKLESFLKKTETKVEAGESKIEKIIGKGKEWFKKITLGMLLILTIFLFALEKLFSK